MHSFICIGLGNPGPQFSLSRHNIGFLIVDAFANQLGIAFTQHNNYLIASGVVNMCAVHLIKPQTFMNNSGAVLPFINKKMTNSKNHIIVLHDELELAFGIIKYKQGGSAKGHNGLRSIIEYIGADFERMRFGVGRPDQKSHVSKYVLERFTTSEQDQLFSLIDQAVNQLLVRLSVSS